MANEKKQRTLFLDEGAGPPAQRGGGHGTVMLDDAGGPGARPMGGGRQMVVPTMMQRGPGGPVLPYQQPSKPSTWGRWLGGPLLGLLAGCITLWLAQRLWPPPKAVLPPQGILNLNSEPEGASVTIDGKRLSRFTPAVVQVKAGSTVRITFAMAGYETKSEEVYVKAGEHPFNVRLQPINVPPPPEPAKVALRPIKKIHHPGLHPVKPLKPAAPSGTATLSIVVRPWAIVYIDHQRLRQTPLVGYSINSGHHIVELVNEGMNRRENIAIDLEPGQNQEIHRDWD